jgi:hypothetical protein
LAWSDLPDPLTDPVLAPTVGKDILTDNSNRQRSPLTGLDGFIAYVSDLVDKLPATQSGTTQVVLCMSEECAYIRLGDIGQPVKFLKQMAGAPPVRFGTQGFRSDILDDFNPARHYTAFVFVGFWLPVLVATLVLWAWEIASFVRYKGHWSPKDIHSGNIGIRHGRLVRRYGATILPSLMAADLSETPTSV